MTIQLPPLIDAAVSDGKKRPFWSVMMPTYLPSEHYLREALGSLLAQALGPEQMQIEVVDDCSPGMDVATLVKVIAGNRVTVSQTPKNLGLAGCWNTCIERARGEWVHILHQDDLVYPGFYESLQRGINANPAVGAAYCRHAYCDENSHWQRLSILEMPSPGVLPHFVEPLVSAERIQCAAIVVRRATYEQLGGYNPELKHTLDWEMWIRIANQFSFFYEPKILASWRNHSGATTARQIRSGENLRDHAKAIGIWRRYLLQDNAQRLAPFALNRFAHIGLGTARHLIAQNDVEAGLNQMKAALVCKDSFRMRWHATRLCIKAFAQRIRNWIRPRSSELRPGSPASTHAPRSGST